MGEARAIHRLSVKGAAALTKIGRHSDGGGLHLAVGKGASRRWTFLWVRNGKQREAGLGAYAVVTLAEARAKAAECRALVAKGLDPIEIRKATREATKIEAANRRTFGQCALDMIALKRPGWGSAKHARQFETTLRSCRGIWDRPIGEIDADGVRAALLPTWKATPETGRRLRARIEMVFDYAIARRLHPGPNPAVLKSGLAHTLPAHPKRTRRHMAALPYREIPRFFTDLRARPPSMATKALELLIFTACRSGEVLGATWQEFDLDAGTWAIPGGRMKAGKLHKVPLSQPALDTLKWAAALRTSDFVFAGRFTDQPLKSLTRLAPPGFTVHGLRSSFRDFAAEQTNFPREVCEMALAHAVGSAVERSYARTDLFDKRRALMEAWATYVCGGGDD